ncbi:hypothetical protein D3Z47_08705 [Lachnospiraceae bacterium]|jgi:predicted transcriptional regulator|nr:hypothetical protein [Lachnospiraceae bacterium]
MLVKGASLTKSEEQMMDIFWSSEEPLTSVDIVNMKVRDTWGNGLVHNIIRALLKKGLLEECGIERYKTQYARKLCPAMTKEEYIAKMMSAKAEGKESRFKVLLALAKEEEDIEEMVSELEAVIQRLRQDIE